MNATVGDIAGNARRIRQGVAAARDAGADLVVFGELALTGYPPEDLLLRQGFLRDTRRALDELAGEVSDTVAVVGFPEAADGRLYNSAAVLAGGTVAAVYRKTHLPNYGVFDERRYFAAGREPAVIEVGAEHVGLTVCEDLWVPGPPASDEAASGAGLIVNISASPYQAGKGAEREALFAQRATENGVHVAFCGLVGGQDELVFDGHSFVLDASGKTIARARQFEEDLLICEIDPGGRSAGHLQPTIEPLEAEIYAALTLGLRDYVDKNGFRHVVLGLSGGIDSALVACLAVDALGPERVTVVVMPSPYSSPATQGDARALAQALGVDIHDLSIEPIMDAYAVTLSEPLADAPLPDAAARQPGSDGAVAAPAADLTAENLQARIRGNLLMALSNRFGWMVLTTGNKSEMSVGYTTLYGDLVGGFAVIKDVPKTLVYRLCQWRNSPAGAAGPGAGDAASAPANGRPARAALADPRVDPHARSLRRAASRPARRGLAAAL